MASTRTKQALLNLFGNVAKAAVAGAATKKNPQQAAPADGRLAGLNRPAEKKPCGSCGGK